MSSKKQHVRMKPHRIIAISMTTNYHVVRDFIHGAQPAVGLCVGQDSIDPLLTDSQLLGVIELDGLRHIARNHVRENLHPILRCAVAAKPLGVEHRLPVVWEKFTAQAIA